MNDAQQVARAHGERFRDILPASTLVEVRALLTPQMRVEIEAYAVLET
jgi:enamine deaminase RidA (YjgF/YER057c/UK114 family)